MDWVCKSIKTCKENYYVIPKTTLGLIQWRQSYGTQPATTLGALRLILPQTKSLGLWWPIKPLRSVGKPRSPHSGHVWPSTPGLSPRSAFAHKELTAHAQRTPTLNKNTDGQRTIFQTRHSCAQCFQDPGTWDIVICFLVSSLNESFGLERVLFLDHGDSLGYTWWWMRERMMKRTWWDVEESVGWRMHLALPWPHTSSPQLREAPRAMQPSPGFACVDWSWQLLVALCSRTW